MPGCIRGCLGKGIALVFLVLLLVAGWRLGPELFPEQLGFLRDDDAAEGVVPSPELAEATLDRVEALRAGQGGGRLALGDAELSSVVRYALPGILPPGVMDPGVELDGGKVRLSGRVAVAAFPDLPSLREVVGILPDSVDIQIRGSLIPHDDDYLALYVERIEAMRIPLPDRFTPAILEALGRTDRTGLPREALLVPLPSGLRSVFVLEDSLILLADR